MNESPKNKALSRLTGLAADDVADEVDDEAADEVSEEVEEVVCDDETEDVDGAEDDVRCAPALSAGFAAGVSLKSMIDVTIAAHPNITVTAVRRILPRSPRCLSRLPLIISSLPLLIAAINTGQLT